MKKIIALLLSIVLLCALTIPASAAESCGDNLTWEVSNKGTLTISGTGPMSYGTNNAPWYQSDINRVIIEEGCTSIAPKAFYYYHSDELRFVTLPSTLTQIGEEAFYMCRVLTEMNLEHVAVVGKNAFEYCYMLKEVIFSEKLREIGYSAFRDCHQMHTVTIKDGLTTIGDYAFEKCRALKAINIPGSVKYIGEGAFSGCDGLKEIRFEGYPPEFGANAFDQLHATVYYPAGVPEWEAVAALHSHINFVPVSCETHTIVPLPGRAPTCTQEGLTEGTGCSVCMQVEVAQQTIPKTAHTYGAWVNNDVPTPTDWVQKRTCSVCGYEEIVVPAEPEVTIPSQPDPPAPTDSTPVQDVIETVTPITDASTAVTDPVDTPKDTGDKNALLFVGIGLVLLGLATSGIFILKPRFCKKKK